MTKRQRFFMLFVIISLLTFLSIWASQQGIYLIEKNKFEYKAEKIVETLNKKLMNETLFRIASFAGISNDIIIETVAGERTRDNPEILRILSILKEKYAVSIVYVLDANGTVVACSPYENDNKTLTGNNYQFRPYFQESIKGKNSLYAALGITTKMRGLYFASPILDKMNRIIGSFVIKQDLKSFDMAIHESPYPIALVSPNKITFATNKDLWLYMPWVPLTKETLNTINQTKQFDTAVNEKTMDYVGFFDKDYFKVNGKNYVYREIDSALKEESGRWKFYVLANQEELLYSEMFNYAVMFIIVFALTLFYIIVAAINSSDVDEKLTEVEKRLQDFITCSSDFAWEINADNCYTYVSDSVENILGYTSAEMCGKQPFDFIDNEDSQIATDLQHMMANKLPLNSLRNSYLKKNGEKIYLRTNGLPFFNKKGVFLGYRGVGVEISKEVLEEQQISALNKRLLGNENYLLQSNMALEKQKEAIEKDRQEIIEKFSKIDRMNKFMKGRELRIIELKDVVKRLTAEKQDLENILKSKENNT